MFPITILHTALYCLSFSGLYYVGVCLLTKRVQKIEAAKLLYYVTLFSLFGVAGEIVVNNLYVYFFHTQLWQYQLFPAHHGDVSYFFLGIWGALGFYKYINDTAFHRFTPEQRFVPGLLMGAEAVILEIFYNGFFLALFGSYIFYYLPDNLGLFSHLSCLQVIPFYFMVGLCVSRLIHQQEKAGYGRNLLMTLPFFWMIIAALILF